MASFFIIFFSILYFVENKYKCYEVHATYASAMTNIYYRSYSESQKFMSFFGFETGVAESFEFGAMWIFIMSLAYKFHM